MVSLAALRGVAPALMLPMLWLDWFGSRRSAEKLISLHRNSCSKLFKHHLLVDKCRQVVMVHQEMIILYRYVFGSYRVHLFHNFMLIWGTVYYANIGCGFIQGVEEGLTLNLMP